MRIQDEIVATISQYMKHGWKMRRALLKPQTRKLLSKAGEIFLDVKPIESELDAIWFSRGAKNGGETWELRYLGKPALALLEVFEESDTEEIREATFDEMQSRLLTLSSKKEAAAR